MKLCQMETTVMIVCSPERLNDGTGENNQDSLSDNSLALGFPKGEGSVSAPFLTMSNHETSNFICMSSVQEIYNTI